jgi:hypothetical protein
VNLFAVAHADDVDRRIGAKDFLQGFGQRIDSASGRLANERIPYRA